MDSVQKILSQTDRAFSEDKMPIGQDEIKELVKSTLRPALSGHPAEEASLTPETGDGEFTPRFKDQEEAEGKLTEQEQAVGKLAADIEETRSLLLKTLAGAQPGQPAPETIPSEEDFVKTRRRKVMDEVEALDPDEENYLDQVASAQARADKDIHDHSLQEFMSDVAREQDRADVETEVRDSIVTAMQEANLDPEPNSPDSGLFVHFADRFQVVGTQLIDTTTKLPISTQDAINKTAEAVKNYKFKDAEKFRAPQSSMEPEGPISLRDVVSNINANRRA